MKYRKQNHCVYYCEYHLVFATKYRRKIFNDGIFAYMQERLKQIKDHDQELDILKINHDVDHIDILTVILPIMSVSEVVRIIKSNTSKDLKKKFSFLKDVYWGTHGIWSDGCFVSTVGINEEVIKKYYRATRERRFGTTGVPGEVHKIFPFKTLHTVTIVT